MRSASPSLSVRRTRASAVNSAPERYCTCTSTQNTEPAPGRRNHHVGECRDVYRRAGRSTHRFRTRALRQGMAHEHITTIACRAAGPSPGRLVASIPQPRCRARCRCNEALPGRALRALRESFRPGEPRTSASGLHRLAPYRRLSACTQQRRHLLNGALNRAPPRRQSRDRDARHGRACGRLAGW